ncbi:MAG TPA: TIGR03790 family protein, partial [Verrucomicrobiae bacterium]|nr:TIGR03790 family protein [Verrucomicrobiae bacterium]
TNGEYKLGDDEIRQAANVTRQFGFDTITDDQPGTFARDFPMSQIALYAGWYDSQATGPFTLSKVEFMPGAFAYHLYSYSANTLRGTNESWCETLLAKGVTATMGCVDEPFLDGTPDMGIFFARWLQGATFGEAAFLSERALSWQTTVLGDPLYRPFGKAPRAQHEALLAAQNPLVAWSFVRIVNVEGELGTPNLDSIKFLEKEPWTARSAVLSEKLGDLCRKGNYRPAAVNAYKQALKLHPTPLQRARLESAIVEAKKKRAP